MGRKAPHTSTNPGKKVRLVMRNGDTHEGKFKERTGQFVSLDIGRFEGRHIKQFIVLKSAVQENAPQKEAPLRPSRPKMR